MANAFCRLSPGTAWRCRKRGPYCPWVRWSMGHATGGGGLTSRIIWPSRARMQGFDRQGRDACQEPDGLRLRVHRRAGAGRRSRAPGRGRPDDLRPFHPVRELMEATESLLPRPQAKRPGCAADRGESRELQPLERPLWRDAGRPAIELDVVVASHQDAHDDEQHARHALHHGDERAIAREEPEEPAEGQGDEQESGRRVQRRGRGRGRASGAASREALRHGRREGGGGGWGGAGRRGGAGAGPVREDGLPGAGSWAVLGLLHLQPLQRASTEVG